MTKGMTTLEFYRVRVIRLNPLIVLGALFGIAEALAVRLEWRNYDFWRIIGSGGLAALSLPSYLIPHNGLAFPINNPVWSLFFELAANFLFALIARYLTRSWLIAITAFSAIFLFNEAMHLGTMDGGWLKGTLHVGVARVMFGFFCGLLLHRFRPRRPLPAIWGYVLIAALAIILLGPYKFWAKFHLVFVLAVFPVMIWLGSAVVETSFIVRAGKFLGALSYPLYILHRPQLDASTVLLFQRFNPHAHWLPLWWTLQVAGAIAIAWPAMKLYDEPVRAWLSRVTRRSAPIAQPATV